MPGPAPEDTPGSLRTLADAVARVQAPPPEPGPGTAGVLTLFSADDDPELVLTVRSQLIRQPGQISFPGGEWEPGDASLVDTALREAGEEVGLRASDARLLGCLPTSHLVRGVRPIVPVVAWWDGVGDLAVQDAREVAAVRRWPVSVLVAPESRVTALHPGGSAGPAWVIGDDFLWGFTAGVVDRLLRLGGWERAWDRARVIPVPARWRRW